MSSPIPTKLSKEAEAVREGMFAYENDPRKAEYDVQREAAVDPERHLKYRNLTVYLGKALLEAQGVSSAFGAIFTTIILAMMKVWGSEEEKEHENKKDTIGPADNNRLGPADKPNPGNQLARLSRGGTTSRANLRTETAGVPPQSESPASSKTNPDKPSRRGLPRLTPEHGF